MNRLEILEQRVGLKTLSFAAAALLWICLAVERPGEVAFSVPVLVQAVPAGLTVAVPPPGRVEIRLTGPRLLLLRASLFRPVCRLDLSGAGQGPVRFRVSEGSLGIDRELKVESIRPESLELFLARRQ